MSHLTQRRAGFFLALLATQTLFADTATAQDGAVVSAEQFVGAWELVDWRSTSSSGEVTFPYGENAQGQVTYTTDGRMSAHLMRPPADPAEAPSQYVGYWGTFTLQPAAGTVTHHVIGATPNNWIGSDQVRGFEFVNANRLILSTGTSRLTWERVR